MFDRLLIALGIVLFGVAAWVIYNRVCLRLLAGQAACDPLLSGLKTNAPVIVYFTTPFCVPCRTLQQPALMELEQTLGSGIQIVKVDAAEQPGDADRWGVFSAPTTFVLDSQRKPRHVNRGVASADLLRKQIESLSTR